jgi:cell division protein FtsB
MNLVGKILTVFIFVMTIVFMTLSIMVYSTHTNWRARVKAPGTGLESLLQVANQERSALEEEVTKLEAALTAEQNLSKESIAKLQQEVSQLGTERNELQATEAALKEEMRKSVEGMNAAQTELAQLRTQISDLRDGIVAAKTAQDDAFRKMVARTDDLHQAANELSTLKSRNTQLAEQVARISSILDRRGISEFETAGPPSIDGIVLAVRSGGLVELSVGADEGLKKGDRLEVVRQGADSQRYLGAVEILQTEPDKSVAKIIPETRQGSIEKEDRVYSRLR